MLESGMTAAARLEGVSVTFANGAQALTGVDLTLEPGVITALVGESGSGKTTLCRVVAGLLNPGSGRVAVAGAPIPVGSGAVRRQFHRTVQMLLQDAPGSLSPRMTVRRLLDEPVAIHGLNRADGARRRARLTERLGLGSALLDRYPHQLSGGQARRVAIVRALMLDPTLLIADEPTAGLDLSVQGDLLNLLLSVQADLNLTMLVSTHNLAVVQRIAHRTVVMYLGQIVEEGDTDAVFASPAHPYTAALLSAHPAVDPARRRPRIILSGEIPSAFAPPNACRFHTRCPHVQSKCREVAPELVKKRQTAARCHFPID